MLCADLEDKKWRSHTSLRKDRLYRTTKINLISKAENFYSPSCKKDTYVLEIRFGMLNRL